MRAFLITIILLSATTNAFGITISIIHSYHKEYAWEQSLTKGLLESLPQDASIEHIYLDTKRQPKSAHKAAADKAWEHLRSAMPDLVILSDDNAAKYVGPHLKNGPVPVVYLGMNGNPRDYGLFPASNITGVLERPMIKRSLHSMCKLINTADTNVLVLFDSDTTSDAIIQETFAGKPDMILGKVHVVAKQFLKVDDWKNALLNAGKDGFDTVYIGLYHTLRTADGEHVPDEEVLAWASANTPVPIFAFWDFAVGKGKTIGGYVLSGYGQGKAAGNLVRRILAGAPPSTIPPYTADVGSYRFCISELDRFGIKLPQAIRDASELVP